MILDPRLKQFATETEWDRYTKHCAGLSMAQIARDEGRAKSAISQSIQALFKRAEATGYNPEAQAFDPLPPGQELRGLSSLYRMPGPDGKMILQWVKSQKSREQQAELLAERIEKALADRKPFKRIKPPKRTTDDYLALFTITDFHMGMYAWEAETGSNWDVSIARNVFGSAINDMIDASPPCGTAVLNQLGDFMHFDGFDAVTPAHGNILDADTRYEKVVDLSMMVMDDAVALLLQHYKTVLVVAAEGNHDPSGSVWLRKHMVRMWEHNPRVQVIDSPFPYYAFMHGDVMLAFHHGHLTKRGELQKMFSSDPRFRPMWGQATTTYIHTGHLHHEAKIEDAGAIVEQHPTLAGRDAYAARGGWNAYRGAKAHIYHKTRGESQVHTIRPLIPD